VAQPAVISSAEVVNAGGTFAICYRQNLSQTAACRLDNNGDYDDELVKFLLANSYRAKTFISMVMICSFI